MNIKHLINKEIENHTDLEYTSPELLEELLKVVKFFEAHQLSNEEMKDKEYMESLLENYNENK